MEIIWRSWHPHNLLYHHDTRTPQLRDGTSDTRLTFALLGLPQLARQPLLNAHRLAALGLQLGVPLAVRTRLRLERRHARLRPLARRLALGELRAFALELLARLGRPLLAAF